MNDAYELVLVQNKHKHLHWYQIPKRKFQVAQVQCGGIRRGGSSGEGQTGHDR